MQATVTVNMDNAAFEDAPASELARILRSLADRVEGGELPDNSLDKIPLRDANGNRVGELVIR